jgi:hypothetical protein
MEALALIALAALVAYGLERNHSRQTQPRSGMAGSTDVQDRDTERVQADLRAAPRRTAPCC